MFLANNMSSRGHAGSVTKHGFDEPVDLVDKFGLIELHRVDARAVRVPSSTITLAMSTSWGKAPRSRIAST